MSALRPAPQSASHFNTQSLSLTLDGFIDRVFMQDPVSAKAPHHINDKIAAQLDGYDLLQNNIDALFDDKNKQSTLRAVGAHRAEGVLVPVVKIILPRNFGTVTLCDDFTRTALSISMDKPLPSNALEAYADIASLKTGDKAAFAALPPSRHMPDFNSNQQDFMTHAANLKHAGAVLKRICAVAEQQRRAENNVAVLPKAVLAAQKLLKITA